MAPGYSVCRHLEEEVNPPWGKELSFNPGLKPSSQIKFQETGLHRKTNTNKYKFFFLHIHIQTHNKLKVSQSQLSQTFGYQTQDTNTQENGNTGSEPEIAKNDKTKSMRTKSNSYKVMEVQTLNEQVRQHKWHKQKQN